MISYANFYELSLQIILICIVNYILFRTVSQHFIPFFFFCKHDVVVKKVHYCMQDVVIKNIYIIVKNMLNNAFLVLWKSWVHNKLILILLFSYFFMATDPILTLSFSCIMPSLSLLSVNYVIL